MPVAPTLETEERLFAAGARCVIGVDEVGRGAIAGPVAVGAVAITAASGPFPDGLRDSKLLTPRRRGVLAPLCADWAAAWAIGLASAGEIDRLGITACLGLAGSRALAALAGADLGAGPRTVLLDGDRDWLGAALPARDRPEVLTRVRADRACASVAAASVLAKVHRDGIMVERHAELPDYRWADNKGYGSRAHREAIARVGPCSMHRLTWLK